MILAIHKYELQGSGAVRMPVGAKPMHVGLQGSKVMLWAMVNPERQLVERKLYVAATGEHLPDEIGPYIGTFLLDGGRLVIHVFDEFGVEYDL